jgi:hypothetical protein
MRNRALITIVLAGFLALTARALSHYGYLEFLEAATENAVVSVLFFDLVICLGLIAVWIYQDARRFGMSPWPYIALDASFGAAGPLLYLLRRPARGQSIEVPGAASRALLPLLLVFSAATAFAIYRHGYTAFVTYALANEATQLLFADLAINLVLVVVWMIADARSRQASYVPFLILAFLFGTVGPLLYLISRRPRQEALQIA